MPRRSERIGKRQFLSGPSGGMNFPSLSDGDINKCNLRICDQGPRMDSSVLWDIGKIAGSACRGEEEEVINEYLRLEERDTSKMPLPATTKAPKGAGEQRIDGDWTLR
ncbi:hypothetical protein ACSQ67_023702 [Phaseolus vulgaris]